MCGELVLKARWQLEGSATLIPLFERSVPLQVVPGVLVSSLVFMSKTVCVEGGKGVFA
jgi:hypothetical protein